MEQNLEKEYFDDLKRIKETIAENRNKAMVVVNSAMIATYYKIGTILNERQQWGNGYIKKISTALTDYGSGYSYDQLRRMCRFAKIFTLDEILAQPVPKLPWGSIIEIINKSSSKEEIIWFVNKTYENKWSRREIIQQFQLKAFERRQIKPLITENTENDELLRDVIKDTLVFDFLKKDDLIKEESLKNQLMNNIILFLQELGPGFALVGKEYKLTTPSNKNFYIDLLMYHTKIHAYVVIEVKTTEFHPADIGQLNFYVNAVNDLEKEGIDNDTVGILLCKDADNYTVKTSIQGLQTTIGISKYKILEELPNYLERKIKDSGF